MYYVSMCESTGQSPMKERVKKYVPISNAADRFGVSRPTFYLFMQNFDEERFEEIPDNVREFLDLISTDPQPEEVKVFLTVKGTPKDAESGKPIKIKDLQDDYVEREAIFREMSSLRTMVDKTEHQRHITMMKLKNNEDETVMIRRLIEENPDDNAEYKMRFASLEKRNDSLKADLAELDRQMTIAQKQLYDQECRLQKNEESRKLKTRMESWTDDDGLMTLCIGNDGRSMVIFQLLSDETVENPEFSVSLIMETPSGNMVLGRYVPDEGKNFVLIDDVLPNLRLKYEVRCEYQGNTLVSGRYSLLLR